MTSFAIYAVISFTVFLATAAMNYTVTRIISERLTLHENTRFMLDVTGEDNDSKVFLTINEPITEEDDLFVDVVAQRFDGTTFPIPNNPVKLCQILSEELKAPSSSLVQQLRISRVFNMEGEICPILPGKRKIVPYMFPRNMSLSHDLGCGDFVYDIGIISKDIDDSDKYVPLISSSTTVRMTAESCSNTLM